MKVEIQVKKYSCNPHTPARMTAEVFWCFVLVNWFGAICNRLLSEQVNKWQIPNRNIPKWQIPKWNTPKWQNPKRNNTKCGILSEQNQKLIKMVKKSKKNYGEIALKLHNDFLQGLNE